MDINGTTTMLKININLIVISLGNITFSLSKVAAMCKMTLVLRFECIPIPYIRIIELRKM